MSVLTLLWAGCPAGDDDDTSEADDDAGDDDTADDDTGDDDTGDDDTGDDDADPEEPYLTGVVHDVTCTTPLPGIRITLCQQDEACKFLDTDSDGQFVIDGLVGQKNGEFRVQGHINAQQLPYTGLVHEVEIPDTGFVAATEVCLGLVPAVLPLSGGMQTMEAGDGLTLTFDPDAVSWLLGTPQLGAVELPPGAWQYVELPGVEVLAVWAMHVWGSSTDDLVAAQMPWRGDLACEDAVTIYALSDEHLGWVEIGPAELDCDNETVSTGVGTGLTEFTWVAYGRPE